MIERPLDIRIEDPLLAVSRVRYIVNFLDGIMTPSSWSEPVTTSLEARFPAWFKSIFDHGLNTTVDHHGNIHCTLPPLPSHLWNG